MSTCQGAPAPHRNCPHGKACDWTPRSPLEWQKQVRTPEGVFGQGSRRERRAAARTSRNLEEDHVSSSYAQRYREIHAGGHEPVCIPKLSQDPDDHAAHDHVPGRAIPIITNHPGPTVNPRLVKLPDIPLARVRDAVQSLLDHPLDDVISVHIEIGAVTAVVVARDADGNRFTVGKGADTEVAQHELVRKVVR